MTKINEDVILELTQYLDIFTSLCLAQSCGAAFRASQEYSFWSPHELPPSLGLAVFLRDDHIGPWKSYSGDEIRQAAIKMRDFRSNWASEHVSASYRVNVGRYTELEAIPGSRWLCAFQYGRNGAGFVRIVDGKTGISTLQDLDVGSIGSVVAPQFVGCSLEPNRILMACTEESYDDGASSCSLFEIILSMNENDGAPYIEAHTTRIYLWETLPLSLVTFMTSEFFVIPADHHDSLLWDLYVYHIPSMRHWEWRAMPGKYNISLVDQWCILTQNRTDMIYIAAIHLPSLLCLPETASQPLIPVNGTGLGIGREGAGTRYSIDIIPSKVPISRHHGTSEYTVIQSRASHRFAFDIRMGVVLGSIHGNIEWSGTRLPLPTNGKLEERIASQFSSSAGVSLKPFTHGSTLPVWFVATQYGIEVLVIGFGLGNNIQILRMTNLYESDRTRTLSWKAPLRRSAGDTAEMDYQDDLDNVRALPYWDAGAGMLILRGPPLSGGLQEYQTCWF